MFTHRIATEADIPALVALMDRAIAGPLAEFLTPDQIAASRRLMGIDSQIIADRTYFLVERGGVPVPLVRMGKPLGGRAES